MMQMHYARTRAVLFPRWCEYRPEIVGRRWAGSVENIHGEWREPMRICLQRVRASRCQLDGAQNGDSPSRSWWLTTAPKPGICEPLSIPQRRLLALGVLFADVGEHADDVQGCSSRSVLGLAGYIVICQARMPAGARTAAGRCRRVRDYESVATCVRRASRQQHSRPSVRCRFRRRTPSRSFRDRAVLVARGQMVVKTGLRASGEAAHFGLVRRWLGLMSSLVCRGLTVCRHEPA
jgi:hypothetical protein